MNIPISMVDLGPEEEELVVQVVRSGRLAQGPMVERLEEEFRSWSQTSHVVAVNNGTTALVAALQALDVRPGDEVITSPFSFVATLNAILEAGATAVFADIGEDFCVDPQRVAEQVTDRTRVLMPVHLYGQAADMPAVEKIASDRGIAMVEDAAQAHGATVDGRAAGSYGLGCFSLYATKNLTAGEGGLVTTDDDELADRLRLLRNQGMRARYQYDIPGHNYRMTELQAAVAIPQLAKLRERTDVRVRNAALLSEGLAGIEGLTPPRTEPGREHVFHQYTVRVGPGAHLDRDALAAALLERGVTTGVYYPRLMHDYDCYRGHPQIRASSTPNAEAAAREALSLPVHPWLTQDQVDHIVTSVREAMHA